MVYRIRHFVCCTVLFALCVNMFGYAVSHYMVKKWSKVSVRKYLSQHTPKETFTFRIMDEKVLDMPDAVLIEDHEIMVGNEMYDIFSTKQDKNGVKTVLCVLDKEEMSLRAVCYEVFNNASEKTLPIKSRHTSLMKTIIKDAQLPIYTYIYSRIYSLVYYADIPAFPLSTEPPIFSPPPEPYL